MRKRIISLCAFAVICLFVFLCYTKINSEKNSFDVYEGKVELVELESWVGEYKFEEFLSPNLSMVYSISIYEEDGLFANIKVDGFQTLMRLKARVREEEDIIIFEFCGYYAEQENNSFAYNEGDVLLELKNVDEVLITEWGKLHPMIDENNEAGEYFYK